MSDRISGNTIKGETYTTITFPHGLTIKHPNEEPVIAFQEYDKDNKPTTFINKEKPKNGIFNGYTQIFGSDRPENYEIKADDTKEDNIKIFSKSSNNTYNIKANGTTIHSAPFDTYTICGNHTNIESDETQKIYFVGDDDKIWDTTVKNTLGTGIGQYPMHINSDIDALKGTSDENIGDFSDFGSPENKKRVVHFVKNNVESTNFAQEGENELRTGMMDLNKL